MSHLWPSPPFPASNFGHRCASFCVTDTYHKLGVRISPALMIYDFLLNLSSLSPASLYRGHETTAPDVSEVRLRAGYVVRSRVCSRRASFIARADRWTSSYLLLLLLLLLLFKTSLLLTENETQGRDNRVCTLDRFILRPCAVLDWGAPKREREGLVTYKVEVVQSLLDGTK